MNETDTFADEDGANDEYFDFEDISGEHRTWNDHHGLSHTNCTLQTMFSCMLTMLQVVCLSCSVPSLKVPNNARIQRSEELASDLWRSDVFQGDQYYCVESLMRSQSMRFWGHEKC